MYSVIRKLLLNRTTCAFTDFYVTESYEFNLSHSLSFVREIESAHAGMGVQARGRVGAGLEGENFKQTQH